jgi:hypothetical protein
MAIGQRRQEMKSVGVLAVTATQLLDAVGFDRDVTITLPAGASNPALSVNPISNYAQGFTLQSQTTRFMLTREHSLWFIADAVTLVGICAAPCGQPAPSEVPNDTF